LAATTQAVEAKKPALAIAIRARFIVYLPLVCKISAAEK
jgi:hypothetical protein